MLDNSNTRKVFAKQMEINEFQTWMSDIYKECDAERGIPATVAWLTEELGELAQAVRKGTREQQIHEIGDVLAWLTSLANQLNIDLSEAAKRFAQGCPRCSETPCACSPPSAEVNVVAPRVDRRRFRQMIDNVAERVERRRLTREKLDEIAEELAGLLSHQFRETALLQSKGSLDDYFGIQGVLLSWGWNICLSLNELNGPDEQIQSYPIDSKISDVVLNAESPAEALLHITDQPGQRSIQQRGHSESDEEYLSRITHISAQLLADVVYLDNRWRGSKP